MIRWVALIFMASLFAGCGYDVRYTPLNNPLSPADQRIESSLADARPTSPEQVTLFLTTRPEKAYRELGIIAIPTYSSAPPEGEILALFRQKAVEVGADGVILLPTETAIDSYSTPTYLYDWGVIYQETVRSRAIFKGMAIQFIQ